MTFGNNLIFFFILKLFQRRSFTTA